MTASSQQGFMQQAQMSQQIGAQLQGPPMPYMQGLQDPTPGIARNVAAAGASLIPLGAGAAHGVAAHFMPRAFNPMNAGMAGYAAGGTMGMGMGGSAALGLGVAAVPMAGMAAANWAGAQVFQGARQSAGFRQQAQANMSFVNTGSMTGRGAATGQVTEMAKVMRDVATETMSSFDEMQKIFQSMSDMGMMQTVRDAKDFERKFKTLTKSAKEVSRIMGTTMEEASGLVGSMRLSGMYNPDEVMGAAVQRGVLASHGLTGQQITQQQAQGASMAHSMGALRGTGARLTTRVTGDVARAAAMGILSSEQLIEATGMEGPEAYAAFGQKMTATAMDFTKTGVGQAMMAIAGERRGESYTGKIDMGKLAALQHMDTSKLASMAQSSMGSSDEARQSFHSQKERLQGAFAEKAGPEQMASFMTKLARDRYSHLGEGDMVSNLMRMFGDLDRTEAEMLASLAADSGRIAADRRREEEMELQRIAMEQQRIFGRSIGAVKMHLTRVARRAIGDPLSNIGADIEGGLSQIGEDVSDKIYGRVRLQGASRDTMAGVLEGVVQPGSDILNGSRVSTRGFSEGTRNDLYRATGMKLGKIEIGKDISASEYTRIVRQERQAAAGALDPASFGMAGTSREDMDALGRQLAAYTGDVNLQGRTAGEDIVTAALGDKNLPPELRAALEKTLGMTSGASKNVGIGAGAVFRNSSGRADAERLVQTALGGVGIDVGGTARLDAFATDSAAAIRKQTDKVSDLMTKRVGGMFSSHDETLEAMIKDPEARRALLALKGKSASEMADIATMGKQARGLAKGSKGRDSWTDEMKAQFGDMSSEQLDAFIATTEALPDMWTSGYTSEMALDELEKLDKMSGGVADQRVRERIGVSGARFGRALRERGSGDFETMGTGDDGYGLAEKWADARAGGGYGVDEAQKIADLVASKGTGGERFLSEIAATEGGGVLAKQVRLLRDGGKGIGRGGLAGATTKEEIEAFWQEQVGMGPSGVTQEDIEAMLDKSSGGKIDAGESRQLMERLSRVAGAVDDVGSAGTGGKVQRTLGGESMEIARALADMGSTQSRYNTETADALEKVGRVTRGMESQLQRLAP